VLDWREGSPDVKALVRSGFVVSCAMYCASSGCIGAFDETGALMMVAVKVWTTRGPAHISVTVAHLRMHFP
jgi:hypothetical protein